MVLEYWSIRMEISSLAILGMMKYKEWESITGAMEKSSMDNGQKDNFAKENDINIYNHQSTLEKCPY